MRENSRIGLENGPVWRAQSVRNPAGASFAGTWEPRGRPKAAVAQARADVDSPDALVRGHDKPPPSGTSRESAISPCSAAVPHM